MLQFLDVSPLTSDNLIIIIIIIISDNLIIIIFRKFISVLYCQCLFSEDCLYYMNSLIHILQTVIINWLLKPWLLREESFGKFIFYFCLFYIRHTIYLKVFFYCKWQIMQKWFGFVFFKIVRKIRLWRRKIENTVC